MEGDTNGVRIIPHIVEFRDTELDGKYRINITIKNISKASKEIRYYPPQSKYFKLRVKNPDKTVAPGLEVPAIIEYTALDSAEHADRVIVTIDGNVVEVPLYGYPAQCQMMLEGPVNFGNVIANSKVIAREVSVYNHGSKEGEFKLKYSGSKPIAIIPSSGKVPPNSAHIIKVEYVTKLPGQFDEIAKVKLEGQDTSSLRITGNIVEGGLELLSYQDEEIMECVKFGPTYYGTDKTESAILYNNGPEPVCFVAILNENAKGQELGVDMTQSTSSLLASKMSSSPLEIGLTNDLTSLVTAIPNQGMLGPYEKVPIFFRFSPRWNGSSQGFHTSKQAPPRQDFALFMQLKVVGASQGSSESEDVAKKSNVEGSCLEIPLTATSLPVLLSLSQKNQFNFDECPVGKQVDLLCTISNDSEYLPLMFNFRRIAHYLTIPNKGKIKPGQKQDIIFSFQPHQVGSFKHTQYIDVMGDVADNRNPFMLNLQVIHALPLEFIGQSDPITIKKEPVFNPGITPKITNEVGLYVDRTIGEKKANPRAALLRSQGTSLHQKKTMDNYTDSQVAFPNDRACSIRPSDRSKSFKTIFTKAERHTYVDPDYAYTDGEAGAVMKHKQYYVDFIAYLRERRKTLQQSQEFWEHNNEKDIAIKPAAGIKPRKITLDEVQPDPRPPTPPNQNFKLLSTKQLALAENATSQKVKDGLNAVPSTKKKKVPTATLR